MNKIIGIDLGTTNSCVAIVENGHAKIIPNKLNRATTPSVVSITRNHVHLVGQTALNQAIINSDNTVLSVKRKMGQHIKYNINDESFSPEEISAMILTSIKDDAEAYLGEKIEDAVITVPAYFSDAQRQATKDAGVIAGFNVLRILPEPTAAALAYGIEKTNFKKILVYDLGGGTFDVSVLEKNDDLFEVLSTNGHNKLGGNDFDKLLMDGIAERFRQDTGVDIYEDKMAKQKLREAVEAAKIELSSSAVAEVKIPFVKDDRHLYYEITRNDFEELIRPLIEETMKLIDKTMDEIGCEFSDIDKILLVGGSTKIPLIRQMITEKTGIVPSNDINPDECVALGAAIQGAIINGSLNDIYLLEITPLSLGIETQGGLFTRIINKNTTIPVTASKIFTTAVDNQSVVEVNVLQGERDIASYNKKLATFTLKDISPAPKGEPQIEVTFDIDINGIVSVSAKDLATNNEQRVEITSSSNLTEAEINKAINEAKKYAAEDNDRKLYVVKKKEVEYTIDLAEKLLEDKNIEIAKNIRDNIVKKADELSASKDSLDLGLITKLMSELQELLNNVKIKIEEK